MNATALFAELASAGIHLSRNGDRLHVEAKPGVVTPAIRERLIENKPDLLALLDSPATIRARLLSIAIDDRLPAELVNRLHDDDLAACVGRTDSELLGYLRALDTSACMDAGIVPPGYTVAATCEGCGAVWLWPGAPAHVTSCPWCFRRKASKPFPRPPA